jgi:NAD(P)H-dependent flavin oxidoreductase YrpB (nitropropane dioxygenase family)
MADGVLRTRLTEDFGLEVPLVAFTHYKEVVVAVSNAGGLGVLGAGFDSDEQMEADVRWIKAHTNRAYGVNVLFPASSPTGATTPAEVRAQIPQHYWDWLAEQMGKNGIPQLKGAWTGPATGSAGANGEAAAVGEASAVESLGSPERVREHVEALFDLGPPVMAAGLGNPSWAVEGAHSRGIKIISLIGNVRQARRVVEGGVDYVVAQGTEAGGHTGQVGTFALVPQVVNAIPETPVLAAGGIGTGKHLAAALAMGCVGGWSGTIWLATAEARTEQFIVDRILAASERDTVITSTTSGHPLRVLSSKWTEMWQQPDAPPPLHFPMQPALVRDVQASIREHRMTEFMTSPAGQIVGAIDAVKPAGQVVQEIGAEARQILERFASVASKT